MVKSKFIQVALVGAAHGVRGEVRVKSFTDPITNFLSYRHFYSETKDKLTLESGRKQKDTLLVKFKQFDSRQAVDSLKNLPLYIHYDQLSALEEEEYYHIDLIGLPVFYDESFTIIDMTSPIGHVHYVENFGAGDMLEIAFIAGKKTLIPFTKWMVPRLSIAQNYLTISKEALSGYIEPEDLAKDSFKLL